MIRNLNVAAGALLLGVACLCTQGPSPAQGKKDDLAKQLQKLQQQLKEKEQAINKLEAQIQKLKTSDAKEDAKLQQRIKQLEAELKKKGGDKHSTQLRKDLDAANQSIKEKDQLIATLQQKAPKATADLAKEVETLRQNLKTSEAVKKAPFVHSVILKMKKDDSAQVKIISEEAVKTLGKIAGVRGVWVGKPAENGTPELAQKGYQLGLIVLLDDADALLRYLDDPLHKQFNEKLGQYWDRPVVYDFLRDAVEGK